MAPHAALAMIRRCWRTITGPKEGGARRFRWIRPPLQVLWKMPSEINGKWITVTQRTTLRAPRWRVRLAGLGQMNWDAQKGREQPTRLPAKTLLLPVDRRSQLGLYGPEGDEEGGHAAGELLRLRGQD